MSIFKGRTQVPFYYSCYGYTRGGGKTWHGGIDLVGLDNTTILMPGFSATSCITVTAIIKWDLCSSFKNRHM